MKKLQLLLAILVASISLSVQVRAAERTAPQFPQASTVESGKTYYLYNIGTDKFLTGYSNPYIDEYTEAVAIDVVAMSDGSYTLQYSDSKRYINATSTSMTWNSVVSSYSYYSIVGSADSYKIQRAPANKSYYVETEFLGIATEATSNSVVPNLTDGNITWKFIEKDAAEYYIAKRRLYEALLVTDTYFYTVDNFEKVYADPESSTELLKEAADNIESGLLLSSKYVPLSWSDYPIFFVNDLESNWYVSSETSLRTFFKNPETRSLRARVKTDANATLSYKPYSPYGMALRVYIDGVLVRDIPQGMTDEASYFRYFEKIAAGTHEIEWVYTNHSIYNDNESYAKISEIGVENTPYFEVELLEAGSLGTEVLYNVDHIKDVRRIKVKGKMNDDDWDKVTMMTNLYSIDLSEAEVTAIPNGQFRNYDFLHEVVLPNTLEVIGKYAFYGSYVENIIFPSSLKNIDESAFSTSMIKEAILPDEMSSLGKLVFNYCYLLTKVDYPDNLAYTPSHGFQGCYNLTEVLLPDNIKTIKERTFASCSRLNMRMPSGIQQIQEAAFAGTAIDSLILNNDVTFTFPSNSYSTFSDCDSLVYAEFPSSFYSVDASGMISNCENLKTLVFKSPTVVGGNYKSSFLSGCPSDVVIKVPSFLVNSYKLDEYWYNYKIEGFNTAEIKNWTLNSDLVMNARERFDGVPNLKINRKGSIKLNGDVAQKFDTLYTNSYNYYSGTGSDYYARVLVNNDMTSIVGQYKHSYYAKGKYWFFVSLPFDFKVNEVVTDVEGTKFVLRYYDGASRAENGASGSWKNYADDAVITAGTGFIVQTSADCNLIFTALENESKQNVVSNEEFVKLLAANPSETASNSGWNLVGNPWQCWYNIHALNFVAPITTYDVYNKKYNAYSIIDDDYAIAPNEAFFVQCPENINSISFPETGRQLTSEIVNQQSAPLYGVKPAKTRKLVDITLSCGDANDKTRVVFNEEASMDYESVRDASKFFAMSNETPQLYTIGDDNTEYAINERPCDAGVVNLGVIIAKSGSHTFSLTRGSVNEVVLFDNETGEQHNFANGDYTFDAEEGTYTERFVLGVAKSEGTTDVANIEMADMQVAAVDGGIAVSGAVAEVTIIAADGRIVAELAGDGVVSLVPGIYFVCTDKGAVKVVVK